MILKLNLFFTGSAKAMGCKTDGTWAWIQAVALNSANSHRSFYHHSVKNMASFLENVFDEAEKNCQFH